jgi:hypothetical protein
MKADPNFLESAIPHLQPLLDEVLFIGGAVVPLYITDPAALYVRPTLDIDILSAATTYAAYQSIVDKLLAIGFSHDIRGPLCRFVKAGLIVDLMSPDESVLGFSNHWYREALAQPQHHVLPGGLSIRIPTPPLMLATKLAAFDSRGKADPAISKDLDDIVTLIDGRAELLSEIAQCPTDLRAWLGRELIELASHKIVRHILPGLFLGPDAASRHDRLHRRVLTIASPAP